MPALCNGGIHLRTSGSRYAQVPNPSSFMEDKTSISAQNHMLPKQIRPLVSRLPPQICQIYTKKPLALHYERASEGSLTSQPDLTRHIAYADALKFGLGGNGTALAISRTGLATLTGPVGGAVPFSMGLGSGSIDLARTGGPLDTPSRASCSSPVAGRSPAYRDDESPSSCSPYELPSLGLWSRIPQKASNLNPQATTPLQSVAPALTHVAT
ncbi:hypothetical protein Cgig2_012328 [Carnegiea gigantea]|uniref:Uncharacterized protein n=1 Tax=Carnegiea gigantea TaxID=171969 RepID=A0A9Q1GKB5_9CARY|nr:hypothetical protein Cgig2_012328 [Carnegiea gigantea]